MKNPWILPAAALAIGAAGGFITGKGTNATEAGATAEESAQRSRTASRDSLASADDAKRTSRNRSIEEIRRTPGQSARIQSLVDFYSGLSPEQLEEEALKLQNLPMNERMMASFLLFSQWAEVDPTAAMAFSNTMGFAGVFVRPTILQSWASVDPENAARYYAENPREFAMMAGMGGRGPMGGQSGASIIAAEWARQDPEAALAWASSLERDKNEAMSSVVREVAQSDPQKAAELAGQLDADARGDAYSSIAQNWGAKNFDEAQTWIRTLPADQQAAALASALTGLANQNPQLAMQNLSAMPDGGDKDRAISSIAAALSREDPQAAAKFVMDQQSENAQRNAMRDLMPNWTNQDSAAALSFVNSLPVGEVRDSAAASYVWSNRSASPSELIQVASSIEDNGSRMRTVGMTATRWMQEDPEAAREYIQNTDTIPDRMKENLLEGRGMGNWGRGRGRGR